MYTSCFKVKGISSTPQALILLAPRVIPGAVSGGRLRDSGIIVKPLTKAKLFFYTFNTIDVSYSVFPQDKEKVYFPKGSKITEKKYSLTNEYAAYLRALLAETEWQGSLFENARDNLPTNISNNGLGYFSICSVISDSLIVQ